jgi:hypothetical protein
MAGSKTSEGIRRNKIIERLKAFCTNVNAERNSSPRQGPLTEGKSMICERNSYLETRQRNSSSSLTQKALFNPQSVHLEFMVDKLTLWQTSRQAPRYWYANHQNGGKRNA